jgi:hypothetical protein
MADDEPLGERRLSWNDPVGTAKNAKRAKDWIVVRDGWCDHALFHWRSESRVWAIAFPEDLRALRVLRG